MKRNQCVKPSAIYASIVLALAASPQLLLAQDETIEEMIVTAQKREQAVLDVPQAISVVSTEEIENMGATDLSQIQSTIPSLTIDPSSNGNKDLAVIRNISVDNANGLPVVGRFVDEANVNTDRSGWGITFPLLDLERVEVLKGPQGTLYGESAIGGAIKYITKNPSLSGESDFFAEGNFNSVDGGGGGYRALVAGNLPLNSDTFGVRLMGLSETTPGWVDSGFWGPEANEQERMSYRAKALWEITDNFQADLLYQHYEADQLSNGRSELDFSNQGFTATTIYEDWDMTNLVLRWEVAGISLTSATSQQDRSANSPTDVSGWVPIVEFFFPGTTVLAAVPTVPEPVSQIGYETPGEIENFNHETRASGQIGASLYWTAGVYYKDTQFAADSGSIYYPDPNATGAGAGHSTNVVLTTQATAVFGEVSYEVTDDWEATVGLRQYWDERTSSASGISFGRSRAFADKVENDSLIGRFVLKYAYDDDTTIYASAAQGFRSGGVQSAETEITSGGLVPNTFDPEELWTYELGLKGRTMNNRLTYEVATYYSDYKNIQIVEPVLVLSAVVNGGTAEVKGIETALSYDVTDNLFINLAYSYNDSELTTATAQHDAGEPFNGVPQNSTMGISGDYSFNWMSNVRGHLRVDYFDRDGSEANSKDGSFSILNQTYDGLRQINARLGWLVGDWSLYLYGENLTNENRELRKPYRGTIDYIIQKPRTVGMTVRWKL